MFTTRPPSIAWESLPIVRCPGLAVWAWFRPVALPSSVTIMIPSELVQAHPAGLPISMADLLMAAGIDASQFQAVSIFGSGWQQAQTYFPYLNQALPAPIQGAPGEILLAVSEAVHPQVPATQGPVAVMPVEMDDSELDDESSGGKSLYDRIEASWKSAIQMERQMTGLRQKLSALSNTLSKMDRDLTPEERLSADREDKDAWEDARRWVRDLAGKCHREVKAFDIGMTSSAGRRTWMEQTYQTVIEPRVQSTELETYRREFETYRKDIMNLQRAMTSAIQAATQNGTSRAQRVTGSIQKKIQERRRRMREPIGGTNMDRSCRRRR